MGKLISRDISRLERLVDFLQKIICAENLREDMYFNSDSMLVFLSLAGVTELYKECVW